MKLPHVVSRECEFCGAEYAEHMLEMPPHVCSQCLEVPEYEYEPWEEDENDDGF